MLVSRRSLVRVEVDKSSKKIFLFCEGGTEVSYFNFFAQLNSNLDVRAFSPDPGQSNTPDGLCTWAQNTIEDIGDGLEDHDEIWLIFDTDPGQSSQRESQVRTARQYCESSGQWFCAESNPCFEVWKIRHQQNQEINLPSFEKCKDGWKEAVNNAISGGFNNDRHPSLISFAIDHAKSSYKHVKGRPANASTEVYLLGERIYDMVGEQLEDIAD